MRFKWTLSLGDNVKRVALMRKPPYEEEAYVAGWGLTNEINPTLEKNLKYLEQYVWDIRACRVLMNSLPDGTLCASSGDTESFSSRIAIMKSPPYKEDAKVAGWGLINTEGTKAAIDLQFVGQKVWMIKACQKILSDVPRGAICASNPDSSRYSSK
ncbi:hypothetical protein PYW07_001296 [Mythimna separata]|uniref:Peptidase S1 domain-containing protein n=1 Tax=Mythimna separata TaxID=271217 RepID=A0AAD7YUR0_MYTSE|nr:hypothetical protein PYW07_001296 [Mythimna separata]